MAIALQDTDKSYIAGLIDSDGCIQITRRDCKRNNNIQYNLEVRFSNTSEDIIDWLKFMLNESGYIYSNYSDNRPHRNKVCYTLSVSGSTAYALLLNIEKFIKGKQDQLQLALEFIETKGIQQGNRSLKTIYPKLDKMYQEMRRLKK